MIGIDLNFFALNELLGYILVFKQSLNIDILLATLSWIIVKVILVKVIISWLQMQPFMY